MNFPNAGYVYAIQNTMNGGMYIGSTTSYKSRWGTHRSALRRGKHHSFILQKAWDKYGESAFTFKVLAVCPKEMRIEYENRLMPLQRYNVLRTAKEKLVRGGWSHSAEFKSKMSKRHKGIPLTEEHKNKLRIALHGRKFSQLFKDKARARQLGVVLSDVTKDKLRNATKQARAAEVSRNEMIAQKIHAACLTGRTVSEMCKLYAMTNATFYKYVRLLGLPLLGHKKRGVHNDL